MNRPIVVVPLTVLVSVLVALGQSAVKRAIDSLPPEAHGLAALAVLLQSPVFYGGIVVGAGGTFLWMFVLSKADFSYAIPLLGFCGVAVSLIAAKLLLGEALGTRRVVGALIVAIGAVLVGIP